MRFIKCTDTHTHTQATQVQPRSGLHLCRLGIGMDIIVPATVGIRTQKAPLECLVILFLELHVQMLYQA